jgi:hypothetical protein
MTGGSVIPRESAATGKIDVAMSDSCRIAFVLLLQRTRDAAQTTKTNAAG